MDSFCKIRNKGQSSIEAALVLMVLAILTLSIAKTWTWFNYNTAKRMESYKQTRKAAGSDHPGKAWSYSKNNNQLNLF